MSNQSICIQCRLAERVRQRRDRRDSLRRILKLLQEAGFEGKKR